MKYFSLFTAVLLVSSVSPGGQDIPSFIGNLTDRGRKDTIILVGDIQRTGHGERILLREQNDGPRQMVVDEIAKEDPAFCIMLGDLVSNGEDSEDWKYFDDVTKGIRHRNIPVFAVAGNHDRIDTKKGLTDFFSRFPGQNRRTWDLLCFRNLAFILLNSNISNLTVAGAESQNSWYKRTLDTLRNDTAIRTIIVCCHHPPFTNSTIVSESKDVRDCFAGPFVKNPKAGLFFSGHCHSYEHFFEQGKTFIVTGGGGGPRQKLRTDADGRNHKDLFNGPAIRPFHFCRMIIEKNGLRVQMAAVDTETGNWSVADEFEINY